MVSPLCSSLWPVAVLSVLSMLCVTVVWQPLNDSAGGTYQGRGLRARARSLASVESEEDQESGDQHHLPLSESLVAIDGSWRAWDWARPIGAAPACAWATLAPPAARGREPINNGSICLRDGADLMADAIRKYGFWPECADLPEMLEHATGGRSTAGALFVDAGANIGACSLHMLLATEASVISFEPGASNLFYASSSLLRLHEQGTIAATTRAALVPVGLGRNASGQLLHQAIGNAGHAVIGHKPVQFAPLGHLSPQAVRIERLDDVLWPASLRSEPPPPIHLLKLDVEGFECEVLRGMSSLLAVGAVRAIKVEVFDMLLRLQGCSASELLGLLLAAGFEVRLLAEGTPPAANSGSSSGSSSSSGGSGGSGGSTLPMTAVPLLSPQQLPQQQQPSNLWCVLKRPLPPLMPPSPALDDLDDLEGSFRRTRRRGAHRFRSRRLMDTKQSAEKQSAEKPERRAAP